MCGGGVSPRFMEMTPLERSDSKQNFVFYFKMGSCERMIKILEQKRENYTFGKIYLKKINFAANNILRSVPPKNEK